jgi:OOP family OmpA-OmpF porin
MRKLNLSWTLATAAALASCSSSKPPVAVSPIAENADIPAEIAATESAMGDARTRQIDVLAPERYAKADHALKDAKEKRQENKDAKRILKDLAEARAWLKSAEDKGAVAAQALGNTTQARQAAIVANAPKVEPKEFAKVDKEFKDVAEDIEKGDISKTEKEGAKLSARYRDLQVTAVQKVALSRAYQHMDAAVKDGAEKRAPMTLRRAEERLHAAEQAIAANPGDQATIQAAALDAGNEAERLVRITRQSKMIKDKHPEDIAIAMEGQEVAIAALQQKAASGEQALASVQSRANAEITDLQSRTALSAAATQIRSKFSPDEADVLQDGTNIIVRLKALNFPTAKATIPTSDFALLKKVQESLAVAGDSKVVIEGHTDAVGSRAKNLKLSTRRAEAVKDYLTANQAMPAEKLEVVGRAADRPIATNATRMGREQNRRIDILIQPAGTQPSFGPASTQPLAR